MTLFKIKDLKEGRPWKIVTPPQFLKTFIQSDFFEQNLLGENAGGIERVRKIQVYAEIKGTNAYLNSGFIEL